jgi:glycosyltransferase involved in cell wall biosynthesis
VKISIYSRYSVDSPGGVERFIVCLRDVLNRHGHFCEVIESASLGCSNSDTPYVVAKAMAQDWLTRRNSSDIGVFNGEYGMLAPRGRTVNVFHGTFTGRNLACARITPLKRTLAGFVIGGFMHWRAGFRNHRVTVSSSCARQLTYLNLLAGTTVIQNGVDVNMFCPGKNIAAREQLGLPPKGRIYLYVSRIEENKFPGFINVWAKNFSSDETLVVAADKQMDWESTVVYMRNVAYERMPLLYQAADALLMPTLYEGCPYVVIEAMSCATVLVASPVGHAQDIINAEPELRQCFEPKYDAMSFLSLARKLLDDAGRVQRIKQLERKYVLENNSDEIMGKKYEDFFESILGRKGGSRY